MQCLSKNPGQHFLDLVLRWCETWFCLGEIWYGWLNWSYHRVNTNGWMFSLHYSYK